MSNSTAPRSYGNWTKPRSAGLLGLGSLGTAILFSGAAATVLTIVAAGLLPAVLVAVAFGLFLATISFRDAHGQSALMKGVTRVGWMNTKRSGSHIYRSGVLGRADWGTAQLPGLAAGSRLTEGLDSWKRPFAMIQVNSSTGADYTVVFGTEPDGAALVDQEQVDNWVSEWGMFLANMGDEPGIEAVSVTIETSPDTGTRLRREVTSRMDPDAPVFAKQLLNDIVETYPPGSSTVRAYVAITFSSAARAGGKKRSSEEMGYELASRIPGLTQALAATGAGATHPLSAQQLCEVIRTAYDPAAAQLIDEANAAGEPPELYWTEVGPVAAQANWDSYRHDAALSVTWMMTGAPRGNVHSGILGRLLAPHRDIDRKRITLLFRPMDAGRAAGIVEADVRSASFNISSTDKPSARDQTRMMAALATAAEEARGGGLVNFGMLVTATVTDASRLEDARAAIDNLAPTARLRLRPVYGSQDSAFAAALPLGLVLPKHLQIPSQIREQL